MSEEYDVYYSTGGAGMVGGGADVWVNHWIEEIAPKLDVKPKLLIHRNKPSKPQTEEQKKTFENSVKVGRGGNTGRQVQKKIEKTFNKVVEKTKDKPKKDYRQILKDDLEHHWQGDDTTKFKELLGNARRINILHGYYAPHKYIVENKHKIHSNAIHVSVADVLKSGMILDLRNSFHFYMEQKWEDDLCKLAKHPFWIGVNERELKHPVEHIPNFYEFKNNLDVNDSNQVGFASRMETRKCPHFMQGLDSILHTKGKDILWWQRNCDLNRDGWKVYNFNYDNQDKFMKRDWGISHSAHIYEPFGYSIFQALDYGKIPILAHDWIPSYDYPFRAGTLEEFHEQYKKICDLSIDGRRDYVFPLREYLDKHYGNKEEWVEKMLRMYNE